MFFQKKIVPPLLRISIYFEVDPLDLCQIYRDPPSLEFSIFCIEPPGNVFSSIFGVPPGIAFVCTPSPWNCSDFNSTPEIFYLYPQQWVQFFSGKAQLDREKEVKGTDKWSREKTMKRESKLSFFFLSLSRRLY